MHIPNAIYSSSYEDRPKPKNKRQRKENTTSSQKTKKRKQYKELSGIMLPQSGEKTVAAEAFSKLNKKRKKIVEGNVNRKTKEVLLSMIREFHQYLTIPLHPCFVCFH